MKRYWKYALLKVLGGYSVCEAFYQGGKPRDGNTGAIEPFGETKEDLIECLKMMVADIEKDKTVMTFGED